jgi:hypothetical protein
MAEKFRRDSRKCKTCDDVGGSFGHGRTVVRQSSCDLAGGFAAKSLALALGNKFRGRAFAAFDKFVLNDIDYRHNNVLVKDF